VVRAPLIHRATGVEETWILCPPCFYAPSLTNFSWRLWRAWRRADKEPVSEVAALPIDPKAPSPFGFGPRTV
jgi:hypothetical protein